MIKLSAFRWVPPFAQGLVRDLRVRWAFEAYRLRCEARPAFKKALADHLRPFKENEPPARPA